MYDKFKNSLYGCKKAKNLLMSNIAKKQPKIFKQDKKFLKAHFVMYYFLLLWLKIFDHPCKDNVKVCIYK